MDPNAPVKKQRSPLFYVLIGCGGLMALIVLGFVIAFYLRRTRTGLSLRSVGESPATADSMGIPVALFRYIHVLLGGLLAGAAGAYLVLGQVPSWSQESTTGALGWIALALVVFASWQPVRLLLGLVEHPSGIKPDEIALLKQQLADLQAQVQAKQTMNVSKPEVSSNIDADALAAKAEASAKAAKK